MSFKADECAPVPQIKFYNNDQAFPMEHVALRLHQVAMGSWPEDVSAAFEEPMMNAPQRIATAMVQASRNSTDKVLCQ